MMCFSMPTFFSWGNAQNEGMGIPPLPSFLGIPAYLPYDMTKVTIQIDPVIVEYEKKKTKESDFDSTSAIFGYAGIHLTKTELLLKSTVANITDRASKISTLKAVKNIAKAGKLTGVVGAIATGFEGASDENGFTIGDGAKVAIGLITTFTPYGWVYGIVDLGVGLATGTTLTDRIGNAIDNY